MLFIDSVFMATSFVSNSSFFQIRNKFVSIIILTLDDRAIIDVFVEALKDIYNHANKILYT